MTDVYKKVIIGVDFSATSDRARAMGIELAKHTGAQAVLVHVLPVAAEVREAATSETDLRSSIAHRLAEAARKLSAEHGIKVDWGVVDGNPAEGLARYVDLWGGDVIV